MYAVIEACGKQYKVSEGDVVFVEKLDVNEGEKVTFDKVLLLSDGDKVKVGTPTVKSAKVEATVLEHGKAKKILVYKYKAKKMREKLKVIDNHIQRLKLKRLAKELVQRKQLQQKQKLPNN